MNLFGRKRERETAPRGDAHPLITQDAVVRLATHGRGRYDGTLDIWDTWPSNFSYEFSALAPDEQKRCLAALVKTIVPHGGWAIYGAEDLLSANLESPGTDATRDALFTSALEFQRNGGVWWNALSIQEQTFWRQRNPDEEWLEPKDPPSRETAKITPLPVGEERRITMLTRAADSKTTYVVHADEDRYVFQLDYADDNGNRLRDDRDEADDLYDLYWRVGRGMPYPGLWVDPELEQFMPYPAPRL
jgi:hypothetical protein